MSESCAGASSELSSAWDGKKPWCALPSLACSIVGDRFLLRGKMISAEFLRQFRPRSEKR